MPQPVVQMSLRVELPVSLRPAGAVKSDLPVPSDSPADGADAAADLRDDAGVQVSGGTGAATEGGDGVAGDPDEAACSMKERSTVRQLSQSAPLAKAWHELDSELVSADYLLHVPKMHAILHVRKK